MTGAGWGALIPAVIALIGAVTAYLKSRTTQQNLDAHVRDQAGKGG
jgi:hypothetical protein